MDEQPNVILRGGPVDGETRCLQSLGEPMPHEDEGGGSITYFDTEQVEHRGGAELRVYEPRS